jgi:hypothetical protein
MLAHLKYTLVIVAMVFLLTGPFPILMSAWYGGNPPPHIAQLLNKTNETFDKVATMFFRIFPWVKSE